jgi:hypothetical protein
MGSASCAICYTWIEFERGSHRLDLLTRAMARGALRLPKAAAVSLARH